MARQNLSSVDFLGTSIRRDRGVPLNELQDYGITTATTGNETLAASVRLLALTSAISASITKTLPAASAFPPGVPLIIADFIGTITSTNTLVIARAGSDTIDGATSVTLTTTRGWALLYSDGSSRWKAGSSSIGVDILSLPAGTAPTPATDLVIGIQGGVLVTFTVTQVRPVVPTIYTLLLMSGDGARQPRTPTSIFISLDQWAILVRENFTCNDATGQIIADNSLKLPKSWTLDADLGTIGLCHFELSDESRLGALQLFGYDDAIAVVGRDVPELRSQAQKRRTQAISELPPAVQTALQQPNPVAQIRAWLVAENPAHQWVTDFRDWLVRAIDGVPNNSVPDFMYDPARPTSIRWDMAAQFATFMETATVVQRTIVRLAEIGFLTQFLNWSA